jgi:protein tyrosine/serine phosphatase
MTQIQGALNFRDAGGLPAGVGRQVAKGRLFRSDSLQFLTEQDLQLLVDDWGLRTILDLRLTYEVEIEGRGLLANRDVAYFNLPFDVAGTREEGHATPILTDNDPMVPHYLGYLTTAPESVAGVMRAFARAEGVPAVIHCAAGKDRTGVAVGLVLSVAGVSDEDIAREYACAADKLAAVMNRLREMPSYGENISKLPPQMHLTEEDTMLRFFTEMRQIHGGVEEYLLRQGVTEAELSAIRENLTEPV